MAARGSQLVRDLRSFKIDAHHYSRHLGDPSAFAVSINRRVAPGQVFLWQGDAEVDVVGDKSKKQAVMTVEEAARMVRRYVQVNGLSDADLQTFSVPQESRDFSSFGSVQYPGCQWNDAPGWLQGRFLKNFRDEVYLPGRVADWDLRGGTITLTQFNNAGVGIVASASIVATYKGDTTRTSFLVGMDEVANFISALPEVAKSVDHAHDILRPTGVRPDAKRQGEWFFSPAGRDVQRDLYGMLVHSRATNPPVATYKPLEAGSNHWATTTTAWGDTFAIGLVHDDRHNRHHDLVLDKWHRVARNREVNTHAATRTRYWD